MKIATIPLLIFILTYLNTYSQSALSISFGTGFNKIFTTTPQKANGFSSFLALGLEPKSASKRLKLMPAIEFRTNNYFSAIEENISLNISQVTAGMRFLIGFSVSEFWNLKAGLFANYSFVNNVSIEYKIQLGATSGFSNNELSKFYYPNKFQAGVAFAINRSIDKAKKYSLEFIVQQNANSILNRGFTYALFNQSPKLLFRQKSLPTFFCLAVNAKLLKRD